MSSELGCTDLVYVGKVRVVIAFQLGLASLFMVVEVLVAVDFSIGLLSLGNGSLVKSGAFSRAMLIVATVQPTREHGRLSADLTNAFIWLFVMLVVVFLQRHVWVCLSQMLRQAAITLGDEATFMANSKVHSVNIINTTTNVNI